MHIPKLVERLNVMPEDYSQAERGRGIQVNQVSEAINLKHESITSLRFQSEIMFIYRKK